MTAWSQVLGAERFVLQLGVFLVLCAQLLYLLLAFEHHRTRRYAFAAVWFALLFFYLIMLCDFNRLDTAPLWLLWLALALFALVAVCSLLHHFRMEKNRISRSSIKESMDNLPVAVGYFTQSGCVKLCNRQLYRLYHAMTGKDLQSLEELRKALASHTENGIPVTQDGGYVFPDGRVWYYSEKRILADGKPYTEAILTDATDLSAANEELLRDNRELERINAKLQKMYVRAEDRIREREYLTFKMKIHDDIGRSLTVIRKVLQSGLTDGDLEKQIRTLSLAAGTLVYSPREDSVDPYDQLLNEAAELGVEVRLDGMLPVEPLIYDLTTKAIRECVTNCVRHAFGTTVFVRVAGLPGGYNVTITNDGKTPKEKITEGVGLSTLRQSVESAGGEMQVSHDPAFALKLTWMREEMEL